MVIERDENQGLNRGNPNANAEHAGGGHQANLNNPAENAGGGQPNLNNQAENEAGGSSQFIRPPKPLFISGDTSSHSWRIWRRQYRWFEVATGTLNKSEEIQVATFMSSIGTEANEIFDTFGATDEQISRIETVKTLFETYFTPKRNPTYERYIFNRMVQEEGEMFDEFLTKIRAQSSKCELGAFHDIFLADKIIIGIRNEATRERLLAEETPTLDKVTQMCRAIELTSKQIKVINNNDSSTVSTIKSKSYSQRQRSDSPEQPTSRASHYSDTFDCRRCGRNHGPKACPAFGKRCNQCQRDGHFAEVCKSQYPKSQKNRSQRSKVHTLDFDKGSEEEEFFINCITIEDDSTDTVTQTGQAISDEQESNNSTLDKTKQKWSKNRQLKERKLTLRDANTASGLNGKKDQLSAHNNFNKTGKKYQKNIYPKKTTTTNNNADPYRDVLEQYRAVLEPEESSRCQQREI